MKYSLEGFKRIFLLAEETISIQENFFNLIKGTCENPQPTSYFNVERLNAFPQRPGTRQGCLLLTLLFNMVLKVLDGGTRKNVKISSWLKRKSKNVFFHRWHDPVYRKFHGIYPHTKPKLELINKVSIVTRYTFDVQNISWISIY